MGFWNNNDREESKPVWLTAAQKRFCVRTNRGWETPVGNSISNLAGQFEGLNILVQPQIILKWNFLFACQMIQVALGLHQAYLLTE